MWVNVDIVGEDLMPIKNYHLWKIAIYFFLIMICNILLFNLFIGLVINNFRRIKDELGGIILIQLY